MYFDNIKNIEFLSISNGYSLSSLIRDNFNDNILYKLEIKEKYETPLIGSYTINSDQYTEEDGKYPELALKLDLKKGTYRISYENGCLLNKNTNKINDCIKTSKGDLIFNEINLSKDEIDSITSDNYNDVISLHKNELVNNFIDIKIASASKFHIWVNSNNIIGELKIKINKIEVKENNLNNVEKIFDSTSIPYLNLKENVMYGFSLYELKESELTKPTPKYPVGTYQIVLNDELEIGKNNLDLIGTSSADRKKFRFIDNGKKLASFYNINIPKDLDPLQHYFMLGKIELIGYFDFNNDKFYIYPNSYVECFMNLFLPKSEMTIIESNNEYLKFSIIEYKHIAYDFKKQDEILKYLNKWTGIDSKDIKIDKYGIYYYGYTYNLSDSFLSNIISNHIDIDSYFTYLKLDITCKVFDDISLKIEDEDTLLDYEVLPYQIKDDKKIGGLWEVVEEIPKEFNYISWNQPTDWENTNQENILMSYINGQGYIKITKQHFKNITGINLDDIKYGNLSDEQFKMLKLNDPLISPFNRFQYWINLKV